ncbi:MAG: YdcH family protein [Caulobacteraceae bacterium]|nr:YdcH family protein [Caulobacteraceae bacterium]
MTRTYIHRLHGRHALLESALSQEMRRPAPDPATVAAIKKRKLELKDRLRALELKAASEGFD